jgi:hypothetical protein
VFCVRGLLSVELGEDLLGGHGPDEGALRQGGTGADGATTEMAAMMVCSGPKIGAATEVNRGA